MEAPDVGPWLGSLMVIIALAITVAMAKFYARIYEKERREIEAKSKKG